MNILVTGGAGFIGSNIVDKLLELGYKVVVVDNLSTGKEENINNCAYFYKLDINSVKLERVFSREKITHVIHHAAQIDVQRSVDDPLFDAANNVMGTINLLECCRRFGVEKFIYASSAAVYGEPEYLPIDEAHPIKAMSPYGVSKHIPEHYIEMYHQLYGLKYTILRYANAYGPRQDPKGEGGVIAIFVDRMLARENPVIYGDGEQTRDFIYVEDIVEANVRALMAGDNELVNISCHTRDSVNDVYRIINGFLNFELKARYEKERKGDIRHSYLDNSKAKKVLDWTPQYNLRQGLTRTIAYYARMRGMEEVAAALEEK